MKNIYSNGDMSSLGDLEKNSSISLTDHQVNVQHLNAVLKEGFSQWITLMEEYCANQEGLLLLTDMNGQVIESYVSGKKVGLESVLPLTQVGVYWSEEITGLNAIHNCVVQREQAVIRKEQHTHPSLSTFNTYALPVISNSPPYCLAILGYISPSEESKFFLLKSLALALNTSVSLDDEKNRNEKLNKEQNKYKREVKQRDLLFYVIKKFHSKTNVDSIIQEVMDSLTDMYPTAKLELFLSQDNPNLNLSVQLLDLQLDTHILCKKSFLEGTLLIEPGEGEHSVLAAPLKGNQAVYGVVQIELENDEYDESDVKFISMLTDSAGIAFENARLYEQSNLMINELRLINEMTRRMSQSLKVQELLQYAAAELIRIFDADYGCILRYDQDQDVLNVEAGNLMSIAEDVFETDYGFSGAVFNSKEPIIISNYRCDGQIKSKFMDLTQSSSLIAAPILVNSQVVGVVLVAHQNPHYFTYNNYKLIQVLASHIGVALMNASLHAEVRRMVITDNLTKLYARHYLNEQIQSMQKDNSCGTLIVIDIDHFKSVNDTYGHQVGDEILIQVSQIIKSCIRDTDIPARWGGEELAVYLPHNKIEQSIQVAERIRERINLETNPVVTVSCGLSEWNWDDEKISVELLFYKADMALYEAKNAGRNQIKLSSPLSE